jgi:CubicO group peptidase (beta-lactamase class C family)
MTELDAFLKKLPETLEALRQQRDVPSLSAAVALGGDVVWQDACGLATLDPPRSATPDMVYPLGSITKVFVATMLMQLVEKGKVALEDPVLKYIPEYQVHSPFQGTLPTSLRQLAAHTSGLPRDAAINFPMNQSLGVWEFSDGQAPLHWYAASEEILTSLPTIELELPPDTGKLYSNLGMMLLGIALERACGQGIRTYMVEHIFAPLGMSSAGFVDDDNAWDARFPTGYGRSPQNGALFVAPRWHLGGAIYTGGIYATAADLARFSASFMRVDSPILCAPSIQRMIHPAAIGDMNLGWWKGWHAGYANYGHAGAHVGFISAVLFVPEFKLSVAVQCNRWNPIFDTEDSTQIARELLAQLIPIMKDNVPVFNPASVAVEDYAGVYILPGEYVSAEVMAEDGSITITLHGIEA